MKPVFVFLAFIINSALLAYNIEPSDKLASRETVSLFRNLLKLQEKGIMFGHQDDLAYGQNWYGIAGKSDVKDVCGDYPAVYGWELGHIELGDKYSLDSVYFDFIRDRIIETFKRGGVNTISWHLRNPFTSGSAWDTSSKEAVKSILPGGSKHELFRQYLGKLADFLTSLKTEKGIYCPVLFRPYHEHTGSWFWWGKNLCTTDDYKALWRYTVEFLKNEKGIHHILYCYSTDRFASRQEYLERYPGDDIIDILAFDLYDRGPDYSGILQKCAGMVSEMATEREKIAAVSETGGPLDKNTEWWTKTMFPAIKNFKLSYVLVWRNPWKPAGHGAFGPYLNSPDAVDFVRFYKDPKTLFQKEISKEKLYRKGK